MRKLSTEISKTISKKHLHILWGKTEPHDRLKALRAQLAPTYATRIRELAGKYVTLKTVPRGKKVEEWLMSWVGITGQCRTVKLPEVVGTRDFLVACKQIDGEYATAALRELYRNEASGKENRTPSLEGYVSDFTNYLHRTKPIQTGLGPYAAELEVAKTSEPSEKKKRRICLCGDDHAWVDCYYVNKHHPKLPKDFQGTLEKAAKVKFALKNDYTSRLVGRVISYWRKERKRSSPEIVNLDDCKPPSDQGLSTAASLLLPRNLEDPDEISHIRVNQLALLDDRIAPVGELLVAAEGEGISDRWIMDPGSNTHVINSESWKGWTRERNEEIVNPSWRVNNVYLLLRGAV
jgi:hypothetical protein